jgi:2-polyprenyl-3-methyl-5-hydroxy-6-metoxy-1,4-benzoquinol methylase
MNAAIDIVGLNRAQTVTETDTFTVRRYQQFSRHFPENAHDVLDIGCNTGRGGIVVKSLRPELRITGLDCVPERLAALDDNVYASVICSFTDSIQSPSESFDVVVAGEFIEHVPPESVFPTLCECFRILRLRGILLLTTPNPAYLKNKWKRESVLGGAHLSQHRIGSLRRRLQDVGFSDIKIRGSGRVSTYLGEHFPIRAMYGSYLVAAKKW